MADRKETFYLELLKPLNALLEGERDAVANMANFSSYIYYHLPDLNWAGFYLMKDGELVLGPFQGKTACIRIALGKGVCGTAAQQRKAQIVPDVHKFPGHIPCDAASNSEIVLPIIVANHLYGVLDIDSPKFERFDQVDCEGLNQLLNILIKKTDFR